MRILLVEDHTALADKVLQALQSERFTVDRVAGDRDAALALADGSHELVLLDLCLPNRGATRLLQELRNRGDAIPVLILSLPEAAAQRIDALNQGADDHIVKPFEPAELVARVRALLRRRAQQPRIGLASEELQLDPVHHAVIIKGNAIPVSAKEFQVLQALAQTPGAVLSRAELEDRLYGWQGEVSSNAVEVHIHNLRKKLGANIIRNVRGVGYKIAA